MTDTPIPPIATTPEIVAGMSPEARAATADAYRRAGYSKDVVAAAFPEPLSSLRTAEQPANTETPGAAPADAPSGAAARPDAAIVRHWRNLQQFWTGDPKTVIVEAMKAGVDLVAYDAAEANAPLMQTQAQQAAEAEALTPPAKYDLQYRNATELEPDALLQQEKAFQIGFKELGVPANLAQPLLDSLLTTRGSYGYDPAATDPVAIEKQNVALQMRFAEERHRFQSLPNSQELLRLAQLAEGAMSKGFHEKLYEGFALHSADAMLQLAHLGRIIEMRKAKKL